jgi:excisionase family DNA binding protein
MKQEEGRRFAGGRNNGGTPVRTDISSPILPHHAFANLGPDTADASRAKLLYTIAEAAQVLSLSRAHLYRLIERSELASVLSGRARRVSRTALEAYVARLEEEGAR